MNSKPIKFYSTKGQYGYLSNFFMRPILIDGKTYASTEHYFQSMKFTDEEYKEQVRRASGPAQAAYLGRQPHPSYRADWESVKDKVMLKALQAKFTQHEDLRKLLLETGERELIEHTDKDKYWADGGNGTGKNMLGWLLSVVRTELQDIKKAK